MPFPFTLPTTSAVSWTDFIDSSTHPSLPLAATTHRSVLRDALKKYKRLPAASQASHLAIVQDALNAYLPFVFGLYTALNGRLVSEERIELIQLREFEAEWRCTLTTTLPGREPSRTKLKGVHMELTFVLETLAYTHTLLARAQLLSLYSMTSPSAESRTAMISGAMKQLLLAQSVHAYAATLQSPAPRAADVSQATCSALSSLALAEATLIVVSKDDPYAAAVADDRNQNSKEWMVAAPSLPKVRAHLFARLCLAAADHAAQAAGLLARAGNVDTSLLRYTEDFRRTCRGKAARFLGVDAEVSANTGEGIAWLRGAKRELGVAVGEDASRKGFKGIKQSWTERKEDKRVEKGSENWGLDAGRLEEARIVEWLETKWTKSNDTINIQAIPAFEPLLATMPSGREYHSPKQYVPPLLDAGMLAAMRAPPNPRQNAFRGNEDDSGDEGGISTDPVGAFPGTGQRYGDSGSYY